VDDDISLIF